MLGGDGGEDRGVPWGFIQSAKTRTQYVPERALSLGVSHETPIPYMSVVAEGRTRKCGTLADESRKQPIALKGIVLASSHTSTDAPR